MRGTLGTDATVVQDHGVRGLRQTQDCVVCDQNAGTVVHERTQERVIKDPFRSVRVNGAEDIVKKYMPSVAVQCSCQTDTLFLTARQCNTLFSNKRLVTRVQDFQVTLERTCHNDVLVALCVPGACEDDVLLDGSVHEPSLLCAVGNALGQSSFRVGLQVFTAFASGQVHASVDERHFAEQGHEHRSLSTASRTDDDVDLTDLEVHVEVDHLEVVGFDVAPRESTVVKSDEWLAFLVNLVRL